MMIPESVPSSAPACKPSISEAASDKGDTGGQVADRQTQKGATDYCLDEQVGYLLRLANQRHLEIFNAELPTLTPTQLSVMARLLEHDGISQNELGRSVGIDAATTNGVIDRLVRKNLVKTETDINDKRRLRISLTETGHQTIQESIPLARRITQMTLQQLDSEEASQFIALLRKLLPPPP